MSIQTAQTPTTLPSTDVALSLDRGNAIRSAHEDSWLVACQPLGHQAMSPSCLYPDPQIVSSQSQIQPHETPEPERLELFEAHSWWLKYRLTQFLCLKMEPLSAETTDDIHPVFFVPASLLNSEHT